MSGGRGDSLHFPRTASAAPSQDQDNYVGPIVSFDIIVPSREWQERATCQH